MAGGGDHVGHEDVWVPAIGDGERVLGLGLEVIVEFLRDPGAELVEQRPHLEPGHEHGEQPRHPAELVEVAEQRAPGARILDLHRDLAAVPPAGAVHLPDRGGGGGLVVELGERLAPVRAEIFGEDTVHGAGGQRRR
jgi:hypothetical protein